MPMSPCPADTSLHVCTIIQIFRLKRPGWDNNQSNWLLLIYGLTGATSGADTTVALITISDKSCTHSLIRVLFAIDPVNGLKYIICEPLKNCLVSPWSHVCQIPNTNTVSSSPFQAVFKQNCPIR